MRTLTGWFKRLSKTQIVLLIAGGAGILLSLMDYFGFNNNYEYKFLDLRFVLREARKPTPEDKIILVAIDDQSMENLKLRWPWPRSIYAQAIQNLSRAGAKVIAFDLIFSEPSPKELAIQDRVLSEAIRQSAAWIVLGSKFYSKVTDYGTQIAYVAPIPKIDPEKTHVGYVNYWPDEDGIQRQGTLLRKHQGKLYQSMVLKILSRFYQIEAPQILLTSDQLIYGPLKISVEPGANLLINFRGGTGSFKTISFENLLDPEVFAGMQERGLFKDKIILIGPTFTEAHDTHATPFMSSKLWQTTGEYGLTPGMEIHANMLNTILQGDYLRKLPARGQAAIIILLPFLLALITVRLKPVKGLGVLVLFILLYTGIVIWSFESQNLVLPMVNPILSLFFAYLLILVFLLVTEEFQSRHIKNLFSRYVSPKVVEQLVKNTGTELRLGGNKQIVTVLFSDIRGFTGLSERLAPEAVVELLNEYFETMTDVIFKYDGTVDKFIGDALMALFGAPVAHPDDPARAVKAALDMQAALKTLQKKWQGEGKQGFEIGVGINTGEAIVGNMGSHQAMGYTAIGDTVNLASRLESKNKDLGTAILISGTTYADVKDLVLAKEHKEITVKGKTQFLSVYEVLGLK